MPTLKLLVEMLHREVAVALAVERLHPLELARRGTPRRYFADPPIAQAFASLFFIAITQPAKMPSRHAQKLTRFLRVQPPTAVLPKRLFKTRHKNLP